MADFNKQRLFIVIAAGVGVLAAFFPWAKVSVFGISDTTIGLGVGAWFSLLLYGGAGAMAFVDDKTQALDKKKKTIMVILGGLGALFSLWKLIQIGSEKMISAGIGCYLSLLAGLAPSSTNFRTTAVDRFALKSQLSTNTPLL